MKKSDIAYMSRDEIIEFLKKNWTELPRLYSPKQQKVFFDTRQTCELIELSLEQCPN